MEGAHVLVRFRAVDDVGDADGRHAHDSEADDPTKEEDDDRGPPTALDDAAHDSLPHLPTNHADGAKPQQEAPR